MLESLFNKVAGHKVSLYLKETSTNIAKLFDSKPPVASVDLLFLIKSNVGWFLLKSIDLVIVRVIISRNHSNSFYLLTCRNEKPAQNKPLQQRLFDLIIFGF